MKVTILAILGFILFGCSQHPSIKPFNEVRLEVVELQPNPIIKAGDPGTEDIKFGFEGGTCRKVNGVYYIFTTEVFDEPKTAAVRLAIWKSSDGFKFQKHSIIVETNRNWEDTTHRMSPWAPNAVFDSLRNVWSVFHVAYKRKPNSSNVYNMTGRIFRYDSEVIGIDGIAGPYQERVAGWICRGNQIGGKVPERLSLFIRTELEKSGGPFTVETVCLTMLMQTVR